MVQSQQKVNTRKTNKSGKSKKEVHASSSSGQGKRQSQGPKRRRFGSGRPPRSGKAQQKEGHLSASLPDHQVTGNRAVRENVAKSNSIALSKLKQLSLNSAISFVAEARDESTEDLILPLNPQIVFQYVYSVVMKAGAVSDKAGDIINANQIIAAILTQFEDMEDIMANVPLPRAIVRFRKAMNPRKVNNISYGVDWLPYRNWLASFVANGYAANTVGQAVSQGSTSYMANAWGVVSTGPITPLAEPYIQKYFVNFSSFYDLVTPTDLVDDMGDASVFAYDINGGAGIPAATGALIIGSFLGWSATGGNLSLKQQSIAALETPIKREDLARLRAFTYVPAVIGTSNTSGAATCVNRRPLYTVQTWCPPSVEAWNFKNSHQIKGRVQLKLIPVNAPVTAILNRFESLAISSSALSAAWFSSFSLGEARVLAYSLYRYNFRYMSGSSVGVQYINNTGAIFNISLPELNSGMSMLNSLRLPESINRGLACNSPTTDKFSTILPCFPTIVFANITSLSGTAPYPAYSGTSTYYTTPYPTDEQSLSSTSQMITIIAKYKLLEPMLAQFENLMLAGSYRGKSLLHSTLVQGNVNKKIVCLRSRVSIDDSTVASCLSVAPFLSYDYCDDTSPSGTYASVANHEYAQPHRRDFCGLETLDAIRAMTSMEGIVLNGFTDNISDNNGARALAPPSQAGGPGSYDLEQSDLGMLTVDRPRTNSPLTSKLLSRLVPRSGNYCGPGWTAGVDTFSDETVVTKSGEYNVAPTSREDAVCKAHDEAYYRASKQPTAALQKAAVLAADYTMIDDLSKLQTRDGLSFYGHAAKHAIWLKTKML